MATCFENLVKHLGFVVRQLEQSKREKNPDTEHVDQHKVWDLLTKVKYLCLEVFACLRIAYKGYCRANKHRTYAGHLREAIR